MNVPICRKCGSIRDEKLLDAMPCEYCGEPGELRSEYILAEPEPDEWTKDLGRRRYVERPKMMTADEAIKEAVKNGWPPDDAADVSLALEREDSAVSVSGLLALARLFPGPTPWHRSIRDLVARHHGVINRIAGELNNKAALRAVVALCTRKLGIGLLEGIKKLRPLGDLVVVLDLPAETTKAVSGLAVEGVVRSPGWFIAKVIALPDRGVNGLSVGDKVIVEDQCAPDGAGYIPSEELGLDPGGRVILVPCRRLPTAGRSEELALRIGEMREFSTKYPAAQFPQNHSLWKTPQGEVLLAQQGEHAFQARKIMASRRGCARNRLIKAGKDDYTLPDGILAVIEEDEPRQDPPSAMELH